MQTLSKIFSITFLSLGILGIGVFAFSIGTGRLRIDYLLLSAVLLLLSGILWQDSKQRP